MGQKPQRLSNLVLPVAKLAAALLVNPGLLTVSSWQLWQWQRRCCWSVAGRLWRARPPGQLVPPRSVTELSGHRRVLERG